MPRRRRVNSATGGGQAANRKMRAGPPARSDQAMAATPVALKIEVCASSGSITPMIFWRARR